MEGDFTTIRNEMRISDYLVMYTVVRESQPETEKILRVLQDVVPEKTFFIDGIEYISIYRIADIPESVYDALGQ